HVAPILSAVSHHRRRTGDGSRWRGVEAGAEYFTASGDHDRAIALRLRVVAIQPDEPGTHANLAEGCSSTATSRARGKNMRRREPSARCTRTWPESRRSGPPLTSRGATSWKGRIPRWGQPLGVTASRDPLRRRTRRSWR